MLITNAPFTLCVCVCVTLAYSGRIDGGGVGVARSDGSSDGGSGGHFGVVFLPW